MGDSSKVVKVKPLVGPSKAAIEWVLGKQQSASKKWDGAAHEAGLSKLAEGFFDNGDSVLVENEKGEPVKVFKRKAFCIELHNEPWGYASNMQKRLISLGLVSRDSVSDEYAD